jgi:hypothetical protein
LGIISLLSLAYLWFVKQKPFHTVLLDHYDRLSSLLDLLSLAVRQTYTITFFRKFPTFIEFTFVRLRYFLGGDRPSQTASHTLFLRTNKNEEIKKVVFQGCLDSHLSYIDYFFFQCKCTVKMHRVFSSWSTISASSRKIQFHWAHAGDSGAIVTSFMQARN